MRPISRYTRTEKLLNGVDIANESGLEIGALATPLLRPPHANIRFVDHCDQAALRAKYAGNPDVPADEIVPVDAVWGDHTLRQCFPGEQFDYVIASHVIEHVADVIGWLAEIAEILRPNGRLILAIPDRRYTYDILRRETSLADLMGAHFQRARRPSPGQVFDCLANVAEFNHADAWAAVPNTQPPKRIAPLFYDLRKAEESGNGSYIDCHCSVFTARSLLQLLDGLLELNMLPYRIERFHVAPVGSNEMSLVLQRLPSEADAEAARGIIRRFLEEGRDSEGLQFEETPQATQAQAPADYPARADLERALAAMQASTSWKITAPMRALARLFRTPEGAKK